VFRLEWTERGLLEFESSLAFIAEENPYNAQLVKDRTFKTIGHLEFFSLGTEAPNGTYKIYVPKTSYFLIFRRGLNNDIKLCAFIHASRDWDNL
jgi:plasmid stabilization system protein ParE